MEVTKEKMDLSKSEGGGGGVGGGRGVGGGGGGGVILSNGYFGVILTINFGYFSRKFAPRNGDRRVGNACPGSSQIGPYCRPGFDGTAH